MSLLLINTPCANTHAPQDALDRGVLKLRKPTGELGETHLPMMVSTACEVASALQYLHNKVRGGGQAALCRTDMLLWGTHWSTSSMQCGCPVLPSIRCFEVWNHRSSARPLCSHYLVLTNPGDLARWSVACPCQPYRMNCRPSPSALCFPLHCSCAPQGIVHGDLTAWNVMLCTAQDPGADRSGRNFVAKVADFGLSRTLDLRSKIKTRTYGTVRGAWRGRAVWVWVWVSSVGCGLEAQPHARHAGPTIQAFTYGAVMERGGGSGWLQLQLQLPPMPCGPQRKCSNGLCASVR